MKVSWPRLVFTRSMVFCGILIYDARRVVVSCGGLHIDRSSVFVKVVLGRSFLSFVIWICAFDVVYLYNDDVIILNECKRVQNMFILISKFNCNSNIKKYFEM